MEALNNLISIMLDYSGLGDNGVFGAHGWLCASRPWEVIIGTLTFTTSVLSVGWLSRANRTICGWNYKCDNQTPVDMQSSDVLILAITRSLAVIYIYLQFTKLRKLGSKYLVGMSCLFAIFSSFVFSVVVVNMAGNDLTGLNEALPFFLLLVDLSKASALAKFALTCTDRNQIVQSISIGMSAVGPALTLDALVEVLVIGVGTLSGVKRLETMCSFGCLSVLANYFAFMTFYPACLALILELFLPMGSSSSQITQATVGNQAKSTWKTPLYKAAQLLDEGSEDCKPNPVTQRVKMIMSAGLMFIHVHKRWMMSQDLNDDKFPLAKLMGPTDYIEPKESLWYFFLKQSFTPTLDVSITLCLAAILGIKYVFYDTDKQQMEGESEEPEVSFKIGEDSEEDQVEATKEISNSESVTKCAQKREMEEEKEEGITTVNMRQNQEQRASDNEKPTKRTSIEKLVAKLKTSDGAKQCSDGEILELVKAKYIPAYNLERILGNHERGVCIRRQVVSEKLPNKSALDGIPYLNYDFSHVWGACCENVIGYMPVPVGVAGPLLLDGHSYMVPMATTEGCLVASTNRGARALSACDGGIRSCVNSNAMTRAPLVRFLSAQHASAAKKWMEEPDNYCAIVESFQETSRYAKLRDIHIIQCGRKLFIRFVAFTGDAMGMNMLSKGSERALLFVQDHFPEMEIMSISGNVCSDKKAAAINWIEGRGKSVVCDAVIPREVVENVLKTSSSALADLNLSKNLEGSAVAGVIGGFNAHAANIVTAIFVATGQDPAQVVCSSMCLTSMEVWGDSGDLYMSCTMPSIELGTIGGGTVLPAQQSALKMLGVQGSLTSAVGENACKLARIVCATVMAGELSLMAALAAGHLVKSHLKHNRSSVNLQAQPQAGTHIQKSS